jgi:hypothetical protein
MQPDAGRTKCTVTKVGMQVPVWPPTTTMGSAICLGHATVCLATGSTTAAVQPCTCGRNYAGLMAVACPAARNRGFEDHNMLLLLMFAYGACKADDTHSFHKAHALHESAKLVCYI